MTKARAIPVPPEARALSALPDADYADAFVLETDAAQERTAEEWARVILAAAPLQLRGTLVASWLALGLKLGVPWSGLLGWPVRRSTPDFVLLGAGSRIGMPGEIYLKREDRALVLGTFIRQENRLARALWARVTPGHQRTVRHVLSRATP
jgi:hypothetical protein